MTERETELATLVEDVADHDGVRDAWTATSFTDRLVVVEVPPDASLPAAVEDLLRENGCRGADEVYDVGSTGDASFAGDLDDGRRYRFVDVRTRGDWQSYVVD